MNPRPIEIVGGGLAGLSLGLALRRRGIAVTVHEAHDYPRHRVCGEFLCGLRPAVSRELGIDGLVADALRHRLVAWHVDGGYVRTVRLPEVALGLSRHCLDARLARAFRDAGGELRTHSRVPSSENSPGRVWATGRRAGRSHWMGLKTHCRGLALAADLEFHVGREAYVGLSAVENGVTNVCGLFHRRVVPREPPDRLMPACLEACGLGRLAGRVAPAMVEGTQAAVAALGFNRHRDNGRMVVGDAYAMIPPFTGDGMAMAFESAWLAAPVLEAYADGRLDWPRALRRMRRLQRSRFARRLAWARALQALLLSGPGRRGLATAARRGFLPFNLLFHLLH